MRLLDLERGSDLGDLLVLPNGIPKEYTFKRMLKSIRPKELENILRVYGKSIFSDLSNRFLPL